MDAMAVMSSDRLKSSQELHVYDNFNIGFYGKIFKIILL